MVEIPLDQTLPVVRNLAARKASAFVHRCRLTIDECEDVESHLVLSFISRWPRFDSKKASVRTFASRVMDKELISILRHQLAQGRRQRELPVPTTGPPAASIHQFRVDVERAMSTLPEVVRQTAFALCWGSAVDAADVMRCSRQTVSIRKHQIREALLAAGIRSNYFSGGSARP